MKRINITRILAAFTIASLTNSASAETIFVGGEAFQVPASFVCSQPMQGPAAFFGFKTRDNGRIHRVRVGRDGIVTINGSVQPWTCPKRKAPRRSSRSLASHGNGGGYVSTATQHQIDAGRDGKLGSNEEETQGGGVTVGGNPAPPAVGGNW